MTHHDYTRALEDLKALDACDSYNRSGYLEDFYHEHLETIQNALEAMAAPQGDLETFVRDIATNYDHDEDAHKYRTSCRVCEAQNLLNNWPISTAHLHPRKPDVSEIVGLEHHFNKIEDIIAEFEHDPKTAFQCVGEYMGETLHNRRYQSGQTAQDADVEAIEAALEEIIDLPGERQDECSVIATEALAIVQRMKKAGR